MKIKVGDTLRFLNEFKKPSEYTGKVLKVGIVDSRIEWDFTNLKGAAKWTVPLQLVSKRYSQGFCKTKNLVREPDRFRLDELVRYASNTSYIGVVKAILIKMNSAGPGKKAYSIHWLNGENHIDYEPHILKKLGSITPGEKNLIKRYRSNTLIGHMTTDSAPSKNGISSERKKKEMKKTKIPATRRYSKKKVAKKVSKKTTTKTKSVDGYVVRALIANGAAAKSGVCVGDTLRYVNGYRVNKRGALGKALRIKKLANISFKKPDGRVVFLSRVKLGKGNSLGVISGKKKASAYNTKVEDRAKQRAKSALAVVTKAVADVPENEFMARARIEMEGAAALMADMKGRDALLKARNLRRDLKSKLRNGMDKNTKLVNGYLERLRDEANPVTLEPKKSLSFKGKVLFGFLGLSAVAATAAGIAQLFASGIL